MSKKYDEYLTTEYWKTVSLAVKKRAGFRCQLCNSQHDLCAHHRTYDHRGTELNHLDDLTCLCRRCHAIFHGHEQPPVSVMKSGASSKNLKPGRGIVDLVQVEEDMPEGDGPIVLTHELVQRCRTEKGAFTNASVSPLGVSFPLVSGWAYNLLGKVISRAQYRQALEGRYLFVK